MAVRGVLRGVGTVVVVLGALVLLFAAYELWGTGIITASHQRALRRQFSTELQGRRPAAGGGSGAGRRAGTTSPSTPATRGVTAPASSAPPANGQPVGVIDIPAIGVDYVVVQGTDESDLELGPGHYLGTAMPGNPGNAAIAGHRTTYLHPFYNLGGIRRGDPIYVTTVQGRFRYDVTRTAVVAPTDVAVLDPTTVATLTLTTCNPPYSAATRLVVKAVLVSPPVPPLAGRGAGVRAGAGPGGRPPAARGRQVANLGGSTPWWGPALWWGLLWAAAGAGVVVLWRRHRHWWVAAAGMAVLIGLLWVWFGALSQVLPAGY
ncbi:MAG: class E sortase [Acidimicrobiales bacterium]